MCTAFIFNVRPYLGNIFLNYLYNSKKTIVYTGTIFKHKKTDDSVKLSMHD